MPQHHRRPRCSAFVLLKIKVCPTRRASRSAPRSPLVPAHRWLQQLRRGVASAALQLPCQHSTWRGMVLRGAVIHGRDVGTALKIFG